jgi:PAS domain S-box-containing protein
LTALYRLTDSLYRARSLAEVYDAALDAIVSVLGSRASILLFDNGGIMQFVAWRGLSDRYRARLAGHTPWKPGDLQAEPIYVTDIGETNEADWIKEEVRAENIRGLAFIPLMVQGRVVGKFMTYYPDAHVFTGGDRAIAVAIARQLGFSLERARSDAARRVAEEELRESEERFRLMTEQAPVMIWTSDADGHCLHLNRLLRDFWGVAEKDIEGFDWSVTMHPEDAPVIGAAMGAAVRERRRVAIEGRYRNAVGEYRVLRTNAQPRFSPGGEFLGMIGVNVDISERKRSEMQRELLLAELNHRVKNTLAVVQGIAHQTFRGDAATPYARDAFEGRLVALSTAHNLLTRSNWENASLGQLASDAFRAQSIDEGRISLDGPDVLLAAKPALAIAMALHELCTNALKYGSLSAEAGRVAVQWRRETSGVPTLHLLWQETGGPAVSPPARRGFGSRLIEQALARDLDGKVLLTFDPAGLVCAIDAPLPAEAVRR